MEACVIVSAGKISDYDFLKDLIPQGAPVIAADGGYEHLPFLGIEPMAIVGDFDSLEPGTPRKYPCISYPPEKDDTDTMLAIKLGLERGYEQFIMIGALGGRIDHAFANLTALSFLRNHDAYGVILDDENAVFMLSTGESYSPAKDDLLRDYDEYISIFPFGAECATVSEEGVKYPLDTYELSADFPLGVSNRITEPEICKITVHAGKILVIRTRSVTKKEEAPYYDSDSAKAETEHTEASENDSSSVEEP